MSKSITRNCLLLILLLLSIPLWSQDVASITGVVKDSSGAVIPGVKVALESTRTGANYLAMTNGLGVYTIVNVAPGPDYTLTFSAPGFKPVNITGLYLNVNATRTQDATLAVGTAAQTVEVSASSQTVTLDTTDATLGNNFQVQFLNDLPIANRDSPSALFTQQPGTTLDGAITGARTDQSNVTLNGLDVNDMATGQFGAIVASAPVDSVQEFRGVVGGPLSSAGEGGGGQYELVTRSGTNQFHGALVEYHRDTDLEANSWFNNENGVPRPPLIRNQFGGTVGGPIKRDKAFFFFDWNSRRDTLSNLEERTVPMASFRNGEVSYENNTGGISTLDSSQVAALDPQGVGFDQSLESVITSRYPAPNDLSGSAGDLVNTAGYRFNAPFPLVENNYVGRVDYKLTDNQTLSGFLTFDRVDSTQSAIQFPGDPETHPFQNKSYDWAVWHTWAIGTNKSNRAEFGEVYEDYNFPDSFNQTGTNQFSFGGIPSGGTFLSAPYSSAINAQGRTYPIPVIRDDFSWQKGQHNFQFGGSFKYINPQGYTILDYNTPTVGLGGHLSTLNSSLRPSDISTNARAIATYDQEFTFALGRYQSVGATYNYNAQGSVLAQGTGSHSHYRYYETEIYFGDTWKLKPSLALSYGVRWQNYSVPYEVNGIESVPTVDFNTLFNARVAQSAAGNYGPSTDCASASSGGVPCVAYVLGGKANNGPGYFHPQYANFAPRLAFAWNPSFDPNTVFSGGAGVIFDHTVVNAIQYQASQYSYLFQSSSNLPFGITGDPNGSLMTDPRFSGFSNPPAPAPAPAALTPPYTPFVSNGQPYGLANGGAFNEGVDDNLKTPYSIEYNFSFQHQFAGGLLLKTTYMGRLGRRLLGQADANQLIEFPDSAGNSGQTMSQAFANISTWLRQNPNADPSTVPAQPWFEDMGAVAPAGYTPGEFGMPNYTAIVAYYLYTLAYRGDFADTIQALSSVPLIPDNVGMGSQFSEFTYYTNKGFSSYNGMLVTLHKNVSNGLQFDLNYTWSHSIDNVSVIANAPAIGGYGFICDVLRPRECRGNSDFDVANYLNGNFIYELPFGRGRTFGSSSSYWLNEVIGGWMVSGLPSWHTGRPFFANSNAFVAGYANSAPAILTGNIGDLNMHIHKDGNGTLWAFRNEDAAASQDFEGPVGFQIGSRNNLRGPVYFNLDMGLGKTFPVYKERVNLKFRADAFNVLNHPSFSTPSNDITESSGPFGVISGTDNAARVLQLALRLEF